MTRGCRAAALSQISIDIDFCNAHPIILLRLVDEVSPDLEISFLRKYCLRYKQWRAAVAECMAATPEEAKVQIIRVFYGGVPPDIPFLTKLVLYRFANSILNLPDPPGAALTYHQYPPQRDHPLTIKRYPITSHGNAKYAHAMLKPPSCI